MRGYKTTFLLSSALWCVASSAAFAQTAASAEAGPSADAPGSTASSTTDVGAIVVTGTRIVRDGFEAPTPVSVITEAQLQQSAPATIADYVNQLPALMGGESPRTPRGNLSGGNAGANYLNLRNLGAPRTLVLLNGRRVTPSNITGSTDINILPSGLVKRVDVVTGGASAAWGSDAVAGVVNFVLDTDYVGLKGKIQGGSSTRGDAQTLEGDLSYGTKFAGGRGHILLNGHYAKSKAAYFGDRSWFKAEKIVANPAFAVGNGQPARLIVPYSSLLVTDAGLIASGPLRGTFFDSNGGVAGMNFEFPPTVSGIFGGGSEAIYNTLADQAGRYGQANVPLEQGSIYGRVSYDLLDNLTAFVDGSWSKSKTRTTIANFFRVGNTSIASDNFYVPAALGTAMVTAGVTSVPLSTSNSKLGILQSAVQRQNTRILGGLEGKFGESWTYSLGYQYGQTDVEVRSPNNIRPSLYALAVDAVANPANPGQAICRSTLTSPTDGCVPINPFGSAALSSTQLGYVLGNSIQDLTYRQDVATATISGDLFDLPAGVVSLAAGAEYRREKAHATSDAVSQANGFFAGNYKPFSGSYNVKEGFAELAIPVLNDSPLGKTLDLNFAGRLTDYSTSGSVFTWKAGFTYKPIEDIQLRLTRSRDIRAPNLNDLFLTGTVATQNVSDPFNGGANAQFLQTTRGNPNLKPEEADTLTMGLVLRPSFLPGFGMSIDYYDIKIGGAIASNSSQFTVNRCFAGDAVSCANITRNSSNVITGITLQPFNALQERARGIDIEASYRTALGAGSIEVRGLVNYTSRLDIVTPTNVIKRAGEVGNNVGAAEGVPRIRGLATITYAQGPLTTQLKTRFVGKSKMDRQWTALDVNRNDVPAIAYLDAYVGYKLSVVGKDTEIFVAADNILDKSPPSVVNQDNSNLVSSGTNVFIYDVIGTSVRAGVRFSL